MFIRCGMLIKIVVGLELGGGVIVGDYGFEMFVEEGDVVCVCFFFKCLLDVGIYFLNVGVFGRLSEDEVYFDWLFDVVMFWVLLSLLRFVIGFVDFEIVLKLIVMGEIE